MEGGGGVGVPLHRTMRVCRRIDMRSARVRARWHLLDQEGTLSLVVDYGAAHISQDRCCLGVYEYAFGDITGADVSVAPGSVRRATLHYVQEPDSLEVQIPRKDL